MFCGSASPESIVPPEVRPPPPGYDQSPPAVATPDGNRPQLTSHLSYNNMHFLLVALTSLIHPRPLVRHLPRIKSRDRFNGQRNNSTS